MPLYNLNSLFINSHRISEIDIYT